MNNNESAADRDARAINDADVAQLKALGYTLELRPLDERAGELLPRLHLPLAGGRRVHPVRQRAGRRRPADVLVLRGRRHRPDVRLPDLRRSGLAVPDLRRPVSVGAPTGRQALGLDGGLGLWLGPVRIDFGQLPREVRPSSRSCSGSRPHRRSRRLSPSA